MLPKDGTSIGNASNQLRFENMGEQGDWLYGGLHNTYATVGRGHPCCLERISVEA